MSDIENEEVKEEEVILDHWSHEHPLTLVATRRGDDCYGCRRDFRSGELGYGCKNKCGYDRLLHEECGEMGKKIRHHMHPQHILIQEEKPYVPKCAICELYIWGLGYYCTSSGCDQFQMHIGCCLMNDDIIFHRSHPEHELRLLRRRSSFRCDACGAKKLGNSYLCITCQYWIHSSCASLADTIKREDHDHSLSLSFRVPDEYIEYHYKCEVCHKALQRRYWIYHCRLCRYAVHIKCAFKKRLSLATTSNNESREDIIRFPVNDVAGEQIRAFVIKFGGMIPPIPDGDDHVKHYTFDHHKHQLSLVSSSSSNIDGEEEEENSDDEDNDYTYKSKLVCDGCITPIISEKERSNHYLSCSSCKYYLHWECFHLPPHLPSLTPLHEPDHQLILQSAPKLNFDWGFCCSVCDLWMNGLIYACTRCDFKADINCASLPNTIYHSAHPDHLLNLLSIKDFFSKGYDYWCHCAAGCTYSDYNYWYVCESCDEFMLHVKCALLPPSVRDRRWDKHHLPLTYDAYVNHPDEFYCDHCETQMNPKMWMYHCRPCDLSFHPGCFYAASGWLRNMKFGQQYRISSAHPHPLTYQLLTTKRCCDVCQVNAYTYPGFHCASCNFFNCFYHCVETKRLEYGDIHTVD